MRRKTTTAVVSSLLVAAPLLGASAASAEPGLSGTWNCPRWAPVLVPGAQHQVVTCLDDLTTTGTVRTGHTDPNDWAGLTQEALPVPDAVPGMQIDGYFPDDSTTNTNHGWNHDSQFVIRLPENWNGGLVVSGTPGNREQYANDRAISDWVLSKGYAFAATDKGNTGVEFYTDGERPGDAIAEWNYRVTQLTRAAKAVVGRLLPGSGATLVTGLSNGGYLVRWQLENHPSSTTAAWTGRDAVVGGGAEPRGVPAHDAARVPGLCRRRPPGAQAILDAGSRRVRSSLALPLPVYWDLTQRTYRAEVDPGFDGTSRRGSRSAPAEPRHATPTTTMQRDRPRCTARWSAWR